MGIEPTVDGPASPRTRRNSLPQLLDTFSMLQLRTLNEDGGTERCSTHEHRPRERLLRYGASALSDAELLAILLGAGCRGLPVYRLAAQVLQVIDERGSVEVKELGKIRGIGVAKACVLAAALEFSRRRIRPEGVKLRRASDAVPLLQHLLDRKQEHFVCISLNGGHEVIAVRTVTIGLVNATQVHPREVFADPLTDRAAAVLVAHNHPSGDLTPSEQDHAVTSRLVAAGNTLGITVLDHVIVSRRGFYSFAEHGMLRG